VTDLERRLTEARQQGVQATKEVQLAGKRVVRENLRLRELLHYAGFEDLAINEWVLQDKGIVVPPLATRNREVSIRIWFFLGHRLVNPVYTVIVLVKARSPGKQQVTSNCKHRRRKVSAPKVNGC
jgi:hypothetical protein